MKKIIFILSLCLITIFSFAQGPKKTNGFYLNPNFHHTSYRGIGIRNNFLFTPNLTVGYMWGKRNRHSFSLTGLNGDKIHGYKSFVAEARYSYDILAFSKNKFSFYISPYLRGSLSYAENEYIIQDKKNGYNYSSNSVSLGVAPVFEYKLGKKIDFVASLPLQLYILSHTKFSNITDNNVAVEETDNGSFLDNGEARIGIRLNLFRK